MTPDFDIANIPHKPWVYQFKDKKGNILYIWKAKNLKNRVSQYFNPNSVWKQEMLNLAETVDFFQVKTESEALYLEDNLIKKYQPPFNNMLKWSNSYAYIKPMAFSICAVVNRIIKAPASVSPPARVAISKNSADWKLNVMLEAKFQK